MILARYHAYHSAVNSFGLTHWHLVEYLKRRSYSSCGAALWHGVDIENAGDVAFAAAAGPDSAAIRYGSWKFVFADYVIVNGSEGSGCCVKVA